MDFSPAYRVRLLGLNLSCHVAARSFTVSAENGAAICLNEANEKHACLCHNKNTKHFVEKLYNFFFTL